MRGRKKIRMAKENILVQVPVIFTGIVPVIVAENQKRSALNKIAGRIALTKVQMHSSLLSFTFNGKWETTKKFTP